MPFDPFLLIMLAIFGIFIFMMFRRNKKAQKQMQEQQAKMAPGVEVMTSYGLFGTVISLDEAENKVVLELSPGTQATVHRQSVTKILTTVEQDQDNQDNQDSQDTVVPDDASALTGSDAGPNSDTDRADSAADRPDESARRPHEDDNDKDR